VPFRVKDNVFWLKIAVYNSVAVEALKSEDDFSGVKFRPYLVKLLLLSEMEK
jgi:hypothetical protein